MKRVTKDKKDGSFINEHEDFGKELKEEKADLNVTEVEKQLNDMVNDLQRTRADFENYRKQVELQKEKERRTVKFATVYKVLPLLDDIDRATSIYTKELNPLLGSLSKTLKELGLVKIDIKVGDEFNPELCEAVMSEGDGEREEVAEVLRSGYYYEGEILRPSMVKVNKI